MLGTTAKGASERLIFAEVHAVTATLFAVARVEPLGASPNKEPEANRDISPTGDGAVLRVPTSWMSPEKAVEFKTGAPTASGTEVRMSDG